MLEFIKVYLIAVVIFFVIDMLWLGLIANKLYQTELGHLLSPNVKWVPAIIFYLIFIAGLAVFVIMPGVEKGSLINVILLGAFFGLVTYATYDLTNYATLKDFPLNIVIIDLIWGVFIGTVTSTLTYLLYTGVFK